MPVNWLIENDDRVEPSPCQERKEHSGGPFLNQISCPWSNGIKIACGCWTNNNCRGSVSVYARQQASLPPSSNSGGKLHEVFLLGNRGLMDISANLKVLCHLGAFSMDVCRLHFILTSSMIKGLPVAKNVVVQLAACYSSLRHLTISCGAVS